MFSAKFHNLSIFIYIKFVLLSHNVRGTGEISLEVKNSMRFLSRKVWTPAAANPALEGYEICKYVISGFWHLYG